MDRIEIVQGDLLDQNSLAEASEWASMAMRGRVGVSVAIMTLRGAG